MTHPSPATRKVYAMEVALQNGLELNPNCVTDCEQVSLLVGDHAMILDTQAEAERLVKEVSPCVGCDGPTRDYLGRVSCPR